MIVRGSKVMLDSDLADLYGVPTGALVQAVQRNRPRFPPDFMFRLTEQELASLKSQSVTSSFVALGKWGGRRSLPYVFSEQGVAMLSSVLRSDRAIAVNIAITLPRPNPSPDAESDLFRKNSYPRVPTSRSSRLQAVGPNSFFQRW